MDFKLSRDIKLKYKFDKNSIFKCRFSSPQLKLLKINSSYITGETSKVHRYLVKICRPLQNSQKSLLNISETTNQVRFDQNFIISDSFHSIEKPVQTLFQIMQQRSIGQDLPAIEGHGGLRPGKCSK